MSSNNNTQYSESTDRALKYRAALEDLSITDDVNEIDNTIVRMKSALTVSQNLTQQAEVRNMVRNPRDGYLDSQVVRATSELAVRCCEVISGNVNTYNKHDLAQHIKQNPSFWEFTFPWEVPAAAFLFGTFAPTPPEERPRAPRRRVEKQKAAALKAPEKISRLDKGDDQASKAVDMVLKFLKSAYKENGAKPLSYFHIVIDPDSFCRTVENIYHVSFLVRDGLISVQIDNECGLPYVTPLASKKTDDRGDISEHNQFIVSLDMKLWEELKEAFDIRQPMMVLKKHR